MSEATTIARRVLDALVTSGLITADQVAVVGESVPDDGALGLELLERGLLTPGQLSEVLEDDMGIPRVDIASYAPEEEALELLPAPIARSQNLLPLFEIEGMLTLAIGDPADVFVLDQVGREIGLEVEPVLAEPDAVTIAIEQYYLPEEPADPEAVDASEDADDVDEPEAAIDLGEIDASDDTESETPSEPIAADDSAPEDVEWVSDADTDNPEDGDADLSAADFFEVAEDTREVVDAPADVTDALGTQSAESDVSGDLAETVAPAPDDAGVADARPLQTVAEVAASEGSAAIDLDVLAVADDRKLAILVSEILDSAVARGANRIHLFPYKSDFFLVFRIAGRLEKVSSAPLSLQAALIEGFKSYAKLGGVGPDAPALGRLHAEIGGKQLVLTVSSVPTVAGQRLVISIAPARPEPRDFIGLGMSEAEARALRAMAERGRGLLLVAAPVAGGRSSTYYALLSHAASAGKTVYSVERSIEHEIPSVAQVLVNPGSPVGAASYFAAGIRQDTDVLAIDSMQSVEDVHLAIEAAGMGKLVIATFAGADIVSAVRRMLDLGAEPVSLASALTLGVGQRVVRTTCPNCAQDEKNPLAEFIPGAEKGLLTRKGAGCPNCGKSGFAGATGIFEVLPFTEPVRAHIARDASRSDLEAAARAAGMRPMIASGLEKVRDGAVSVDELDRVLRFRA
jgi:type II secretory ATPase GspE/PulE/Tfp pilus assembly ATPase PilB-like protein